MTFKDIRDRIQNLLIFGGWTNTAIKPDYAYLANMGLKLFTQESQHYLEFLTLTTAKNQNVYSVIPDPNDPRDWVMLFNDAAINFDQPCPLCTNYTQLAAEGQLGLQVPGSMQPPIAYGLNSAWLPQTALNNLDNMDRLWRFTPPSTPQNWFWYDPKHIGLWPCPCIDGTPVQWLGVRYEPLMVNDTDTPMVPDVDCEGICLIGAWYHGKLYARGDEIQTIETYKTEGFAFASRTKEIMAAKNAELSTRYVSRPPQEYMISGAKQIPYFEFTGR